MKLKRHLFSFKTFFPLMIVVILSLGFSLLSGAKNPLDKLQQADHCLTCHEDIVNAFNLTAHKKESCGSCHRGVEKHAEEGTRESIFFFYGGEKTG